MNIEAWYIIYAEIFGFCSPVDNYRDFKCDIGVLPEVAEEIFQRYGTYSSVSSRRRLLMAFHYLKTYPPESAIYRRFGYRTRTTYRQHLWETLNYLGI